MNEHLPFLCAESSAVPILLCPAELASQWEGINAPSGGGRIIAAEFLLNAPDGPHIDYDRACDLADEYLNLISIGSGQALLFGDEIPTLYWIAAESFIGGYALTWLYLPAEELNYQKLINSLPENFFRDTGCNVTCTDKGFLLFPSTNAPMDSEYFEFIEVNLPAGIYAATLGFYETPNTSLRIIKIQRKDS